MYLTVSEVAAQLRISNSSVYLLIESGRLAHHRIGPRKGAIRVSPDDLAAYMAECRQSEVETRTTSQQVRSTTLKHIKL